MIYLALIFAALTGFFTYRAIRYWRDWRHEEHVRALLRQRYGVR